MVLVCSTQGQRGQKLTLSARQKMSLEENGGILTLKIRWVFQFKREVRWGNER